MRNDSMSQRTPVDGKWRDISGPGDEQSMRDRMVAFLTRGFAALPDPKHWYPQRCVIELKRRTYSGHRWKYGLFLTMDIIEQLKSDGSLNAAKEMEAARKKGLVSVIVDGKQHHTLNPAKW
jgi:hypothetical protein